MIDVNQVIKNVESNCNVRVFIDQFADNDECAFYIPEEQAIGINPSISDSEAIYSIIHEVAHHVDISENGNPNRRDIDGEVIAHCCESIVCDDQPINSKVIDEIAEEVREAYFINGVVSIDADDINEVANRVREIVS